ncbi:MAG: hypothetical protein A2Y45_01765 [Tenericutes bacterium GWC2_34_14]|nr:MAG: hypothetical protein A2Z84_07290 [Tenericutes bacterium GWA2_35_7]OHE28260.1 MAG: hypothetical protein A2Y45_01765 [Tenericutes bacterium GWC2_34_14]OHE33114.1 MAG: hypothetical protein A2012_00315 [Tenericutes bacterium GWE2_34_108]OHE36234.1 MAG: hypothetical protein A2Y46_07305 [Tenericutes bacterium GWF1_35_14]OHE38724.1 MAG: hypothetical protein A2Y44_04925 [Tenericutes bacterium GWF2_35_184]OHE44776.1 MAG: hypothetical protein A2221_00970 [Tenericutes bacterium RIFOXYA2_FULL_36_3
MKKLLFVLLGLSLTLGLAACGSLNQDGIPFNLDSDQDVLAFQAISSVSLLSSQELTVLETQRVSRMSEDVVTPMEQIEPYLELFEQLLAQSNGLDVVTEASDLPEYETKQVFTTIDLLGNTVTYTMYYSNVVEEATIQEDAEDNEETDEIEDDNENTNENDESEFAIAGILIHGDVTYQITGKHEIEDDEEKIEFTSMLNETDFVEVTYKIEDEEVKFEYVVYQNGQVVNESQIKIENEDDELKIEFSFVDGANSGEYEFKLETEDGEDILKIEFYTMIDGVESEGEAKVKVMIDEVTGETYYTVVVKGSDDDEEHEESFDRDMDDDEDDEDDEDEVEDEEETEE